MIVGLLLVGALGSGATAIAMSGSTRRQQFRCLLPNIWLGGIKRMFRVNIAFGALVLAQFAHSVEEYVGKLWESFLPARFLTGLISSDRELGFIVINSALVAFGLWCLVFPVRKAWPSAAGFIWFWIVLATINGIGHPAWTIRQGGYTPGVLTAPILLAIAVYLAFQLRKRRGPL